MHASSFDKMQRFKDKYLSEIKNTTIKIVDLGSTNIYGCYRPIFEEPKWQYTGVDLAPGDNVDLVLSDPYSWLEIESDSVDVFISGQTFEHIEFFWVTMGEIARILKPGGICCIIAPSKGPEHKYPVDCWRFYSDGFKSLASYVSLDVLDASTSWDAEGYDDGSDVWGDTILVAKKPEEYPSKSHETIPSRVNGSDDILSKLAPYIFPDTDILKIGSDIGLDVKYLNQKINCVVDGVNLSKEASDEKKRYYREIVDLSPDDIDLQSHFDKNQYNTIILTDALAYSKNSETLLNSCKKLLSDDGKLIVSVLNITHSTILGCLLDGQFPHNSHINFFTRDSIASLLSRCGYTIESIDPVTVLPEDTELGDSLTGLPAELQKLIFDRKDALSYQYVLVCRIDDKESKTEGMAIATSSSHPKILDLRRHHVDRLNQKIEELDVKLAAAHENQNEVMTTITELRNHINEQNQTILAYKTFVARIEKNMLYRLYRKIKTLV